MRILHVNKYLYRRGGAETYLHEAARLMADAGHQVEFFGMSHPEHAQLRYARFFPPQMELGDGPAGGPVDRARTAGRMVWSRVAERGMAAVLDDFRPDVVHLHNIYHQLSPSVLRPIRQRGIRAVMTLHDYKLACASYQLLDHGRVCTACLDGSFRHAVTRRCKDGSVAMSGLLAVESTLHRRLRAYAPVAQFLCPSRFLLDTMARAEVYPDRMRHLPNFVLPDPQGPAGDPAGPVVVASRLSPEKGLDCLVRAAALLPERVPVVIAGEGPDRDRLERLAAGIAPGRVTFTGRLERAGTRQLLRGAGAVAVPSRWYENQPMLIIEALAAGVPVVGTDLGGIPELIRTGVDGAVVPVDDPPALAGALRTILADPVRWKAMSAAARDRYDREFSPTVHRARLTAAYREISLVTTGSHR